LVSFSFCIFLSFHKLIIIFISIIDLFKFEVGKICIFNNIYLIIIFINSLVKLFQVEDSTAFFAASDNF